jgi:hypothetical protein
MATSQNSKEENRKKHRRLTEVQLELDDLRERKGVIEARHTKDISSGTSLDGLGYHERLKLLDAELILRLKDDSEYQDLRKREKELRLELSDLEYDLEERLFNELPRRGLSLYEESGEHD